MITPVHRGSHAAAAGVTLKIPADTMVEHPARDLGWLRAHRALRAGRGRSLRDVPRAHDPRPLHRRPEARRRRTTAQGDRHDGPALPGAGLVHPQRLQPGRRGADPARHQRLGQPGARGAGPQDRRAAARRRSTCSRSTTTSTSCRPGAKGQWVRNVRANDGQLDLLVGKQRTHWVARELADADKVDVLRAYLRRWKAEVGVFFDGVGPGLLRRRAAPHRAPAPRVRAHRVADASHWGRARRRLVAWAGHVSFAVSTTRAPRTPPTRWSTVIGRSPPAPRSPRCGIGTSGSSGPGRSHRTSAPGCRTCCSARSRCELTHDPSYVGLVFFAQLGPLLFLAPLGGTLADILDRRKLLIWMQLEQVVFSVLLAVLASASHPNQWAIFFCVLAIGIGNALSGPAIERAPPDAGAPRGPPRRGVAPVGADEPVAGHRPGDRRTALRRVRRRHGVRAQRAHLRVRDRAASSWPSTRPRHAGRAAETGAHPLPVRVQDRRGRPADPPRAHHDDRRSRSSR